MYQGEGAALAELCRVLLKTDTRPLWRFQKYLQSLLHGSLSDHFQSDGRTAAPDRAIIEALENCTAQILHDRKRRKQYEVMSRKGTLPEIDTEEREDIENE